MSSQAKKLTERFKAFNNGMIAFVEKCSDEAWKKICPGEKLPIGVVASHVAKRHYGAIDWAKMIVAGEKLPEITKETNEQINAELAEKWPNINVIKDAPADASEWDDVKDKLQYLEKEWSEE